MKWNSVTSFPVGSGPVGSLEPELAAGGQDQKQASVSSNETCRTYRAGPGHSSQYCTHTSCSPQEHSCTAAQASHTHGAIGGCATPSCPFCDFLLIKRPRFFSIGILKIQLVCFGVRGQSLPHAFCHSGFFFDL